LGYGDPALSEMERADAAAALSAAAAVWDPATLFIVGGLPEEARQPIRAALPSSIITQAALDEAANDAALPRDETRQEVAISESGELIWREWDDKEVAREEHRVEGTLTLARNFPPRTPSPSGEQDGQGLDEMLEDETLPSAFRTWLESFLVAKQLSLPIYSDDRYVRQAAHQFGLRAFGTVALMDALVDQGRATDELRRSVRAVLHESRAWGLEPSAAELSGWAEQHDFRLTRGLRAAFLDRMSWRSDRLGMATRVLAFLNSVLVHAPDRFSAWAVRILDSCVDSLPRIERGRHARLLLALALNPFGEPPLVSDACLAGLIAEFRQLPPHLRLGSQRRDVLLDAIEIYLLGAGGLGEDTKLAVFNELLGRLPRADRQLAIDTFTVPSRDEGQADDGENGTTAERR
jgi:hypothetical protein